VKTVTLSDAVADVLRRSTVDNATVYLPGEQLDRKLYQDVNKTLEAMGGKWNRKAKGHTFAAPHETVAAKFDEMLERGVYAPPSKNGYFPTPPSLVDRLIELAEIEPHYTVLEPSAGQGAIADRIRPLVDPRNLYLVEILSENLSVLHGKGYDYPKLVPGDFLTTRFMPSGFDRVVMNPPFEKQADIDHVMHALGMLKAGGRLVSIMAAGVTFRDDRKAREFRSVVDVFGGTIETNPPGSFRESGTDVNTVTVVLDKPEVAS
jgi:phospholipid N-methyltransferase